MLFIKRTFLVFVFFGAINTSLFSQDLRSDTLDILHTKIHMDITDFSGQSIAGYSQLTCSPLVPNVGNLNVDLLKLTIDSVTMNGSPLSSQYNDTLLQIRLGQSFNVNDTFIVSIYYHGQPQKESWGGFRFGGGYAFNLGVGFNTDPHSFGRAWFPCYDNFVERSTYSFEIISSGGKTSYCNGELTGQLTLSGDTIMRSWEMNESIPSYLVNVAVADYQELTWNFHGILDTIPVLLAVVEADSAKLRSSFAHLDDAMIAFENAYGPYRFNKIGYCIVPMSGGMEHASNISYAKSLVNGTLTYESVMAHELAHMWWGDLVTCDKEEEMWINEGMASYSEHVFFESLYGKQAYIDAVKSNFIKCIQYLHVTEEKYWPVSGVPHQYTYSSHVYDKGAVVAHNLRGYMGDSLFFSGLEQFLADYSFQDVNSYTLRDKLGQYSGIDLTDFFDDWVFGPGYANFNIDSVTVVPTPGLNDVTVYIHQKKRGNTHFFTKVPISVSFYDQQLNAIHENVLVSGEYSSFQFKLPIVPVLTALNTDDKLNLATTADQQVISEPGNYVFVNGKWNMEVTKVTDSMFFRVEHHWAAPDPGPTGYRMSNYRYWELKGIGQGGFAADAYVNYDGGDNTSGGIGNLDKDLLQNGPDSILLMYRKDPSLAWREYPYYKKIKLGSVPFGRMELDSVLFGQYCFANGVSYLSAKSSEKPKSELRLSPNPASDLLRIENTGQDPGNLELLIYNAEGKRLWNQHFKNPTEIDTSSFKAGMYFVVVFEGEKQAWTSQFVVSH